MKNVKVPLKIHLGFCRLRYDPGTCIGLYGSSWGMSLGKTQYGDMGKYEE